MAFAMKLFLVLVTILVVVSPAIEAQRRSPGPRLSSGPRLSAATQQEWTSFKSLFRKNYVTPMTEYLKRLIFSRNRDTISKHNAEADQGLHSFTLGPNKYADMDIRLINAKMNGFRAKPRNPSRLSVTPLAAAPLPASVNWAEKGYVSKVKDQGQCGSCYAFTATGAMESAYAIKNRVAANLSEQQLVDCSMDYDNQGCNGGFMDSCFEYIKDNGGIESGPSYPYEEKDTNGCRDNGDAVMTVTSYADLPKGSEAALKEAVANIGPVAVAIDAGQRSFQLYKDGIYNEPRCTRNVNHAVLVVGYGRTQRGQDYWVVKNSWGTSWGKNGYIYMARGKNHCGIADMASYPVVK